MFAAGKFLNGTSDILDATQGLLLKKLIFLLRVVIIIGFFGVTASPLFAADQEPTLSATEQQQILAEFSRLLLVYYVIPEQAKNYASAIRLAVENGEFATARSTDEFIEQTSRLIQATYADKHLSLLTPEKFRRVMAMFYPEESDNGSERMGHESPTAAPEGQSLAEIGIGRVAEISRDGLNQVGFLEMLRFDGSSRSQQFIDRVLSTFTESDGIIIDLRRCGGGDGSMVNFLSNYFFAEPTHLLSSSFGVDESGRRPLIERWTTPNHLSTQVANIPLKILVSSETFSAAESFAFGMQAVGRAELVGETTGGGGYMNDFYPLPHDLGASISVGRTFDPRTGKGWQGIGVVPDLEVQRDHALAAALDVFTTESGKLVRIAEDKDGFAIYKRLQAYTNAWYGADAETMATVLADNFQAIYKLSDTEFERITRNQLIEQTAAGTGSRANKIYYNRIIKNIELDGDTAMVTLVLRETVHAMELQKSGGVWLISRDTFIDKVHG